jgi:hypothetical protein
MLAYAGRADEAADVRFDRARLTPDTIALLSSLGLDVNAAEAEISWIAGARSGSRTVLEMNAEKAGVTSAELILRAPGGAAGKHPHIEIATRGASLQVLIATPLAPEEGGESPTKTLVVDGRKIRLPATLPLRVAVPDGAAMRAQFAHSGAPQPAEFVLGGAPVSASDEDGLKVRAIGVRRSGSSNPEYDYFACASRPGSISWRGAASLTRGSCPDTGAAIRASRLKVTGAGLELKMHGAGWSQSGGELITPDVLSRIAENKVLAGTALAVNIALFSWLLLEFLGPFLGRVRGSWSGGLFISYRREDSAAQAGRLHDHLSARFGADRVFMDVDAIGLGEDFARKIQESLDVTDALLAVIGKRWLDATDDKGRRRLDDPLDFVRTEIATALERGAIVIPVLVGGARMPREDELPPALAPLARANAIDISDSRFGADVRTLIESLAQGRVKESLEPGAREPA